jgi:hypothetical protein
MSNTASDQILADCKRIIDKTEEKVEAFLAGKMPEKYGITKLSQEIVDEEGFALYIVSPIVSAYVMRDPRIISKKGRYGGGFQKTDKPLA